MAALGFNQSLVSQLVGLFPVVLKLIDPDLSAESGPFAASLRYRQCHDQLGKGHAHLTINTHWRIQKYG